MAYFKATIEVLIWADEVSEACDALSECLREQLREFAGPSSSIIDWRYADNHSLPVPDSGVGFEYDAGE